MRNILVIITHSLGELDVLLPLFAGVKEKHDINVKIIFAVKQIYRQFESDDFYRYCVKELDIEISLCQLPNKFDYRDGLFKTRIGALILKSYFGFLKIIKYPLLIPNLVWADSYMHETTNQKGSTFMLSWASKYYSKKSIFVYHHGHSLNQVSLNPKKIYQAESRVFLLFSNLNKEWAESIGYNKQIVIGFPKLFPEWISLLQKYTNVEHFRDHILIFSRQAVHPYYMDIDKYESLLVESYETIRHYYKDNLIVIKPHPRESVQIIKKIIDKGKMKNIQISLSHSGVLSKNAIMAISFWTSAIFDSLSLNVPTIEFYKEAKNFRLVEPKGSLHKILGIDSVDKKGDFAKFAEKVKSNKYEIPKIICELSQSQDVSFIATN